MCSKYSGCLLIRRKNKLVANDSLDDPGPSPGRPDKPPQEQEMKGDFDSGANDLWNLYRKRAKYRDDNDYQSLKEAMADSFLFVRLYLDHVHNGASILMLLLPTGRLIRRRAHTVPSRKPEEPES